MEFDFTALLLLPLGWLFIMQNKSETKRDNDLKQAQERQDQITSKIHAIELHVKEIQATYITESRLIEILNQSLSELKEESKTTQELIKKLKSGGNNESGN